MRRKHKNNTNSTHNVLLWLEELHKTLKEELLVFWGFVKQFLKKYMFFTTVNIMLIGSQESSIDYL